MGASWWAAIGLNQCVAVYSEEYDAVMLTLTYEYKLPPTPEHE